MSSIFESKILRAATLYGALALLGGGAWAFGENTGYSPVLKRDFIGFMNKEFKMAMDQTEQNTLAIANQSFIRIEEKKDRGAELSWEEKRDYCTNARILQYPVQGCLPDGQPNLIVTTPNK